jgi:diphthine synthase
MFYLIGLGMDVESISVEALEALEECDRIYLESYTVDFPYNNKKIEAGIGKKIEVLNRVNVEDESILKDANEKNVALLVYGDSLSATTHFQLILSCKKKKIKYKVFHNASIMNVVAESGLSLYKFGKTSSMPNWKEHTNKPTSFINYVKENLSIKAHSLILTDIGLEFKDAALQLKESSEKESLELPEKIVVISNGGTNKQKIFYDKLEELMKLKIDMPFCFIIPSEMHFLEEEGIKEFSEN